MDRDCKILSIPSDVCHRLFSEEAVCVCAQSPAQTYWLPAFIGEAESPVSMVSAMFSVGGASGCVHCFLSCLVLFLNEDLTEPAFIIIFTDEIKSLKL